MKYEGIVYRPPSEAYSYIIQVTIGCAHNTCLFCNMYRQKQFRVREMEEIKEELQEAARKYGVAVRKVFLADGDALCLPTSQMLEILSYIKEQMPWVERVSAYATAQDILEKSREELYKISKAGLKLLYIGAESGDDIVLHQMGKGVDSSQIQAAGIQAKECGFQTSVTLISGLGGKERHREHALASADLISQMKPDYLGFLTLMLEEPAPICRLVERGDFLLLELEEVMEEMELFLQRVDAEGTVFRANHASNYVSLRGTLNQDRRLLLEQVKEVKESMAFKQEVYRRL